MPEEVQTDLKEELIPQQIVDNQDEIKVNDEVNEKQPLKEKKRFVARRKGDRTSLVRTNKPSTRILNPIPADILSDKELNQAIKLLPSNYNFEIHKTVWNIRKHNAKRVALQMPEGLLIYSLIISDILEQFCNVETIVMGDVTYGACCIDDFTAKSLDCDFIVHYAHSCLVPVDIMSIKVLYIFVTITLEETHVINTLKLNFPANSNMAIFGTIQFNPSIHSIKRKLETDVEHPIYLNPPQLKPLSKAEILGCSAPRLDSSHILAMIYLGDGRFHLESAMIQNPEIPAYRYDPYSRKFTREYYDHDQMHKVRRDAINIAKNAKTIGLILGALGRQGNPITVGNLQGNLVSKGFKVVKIILSEILPQKLSMFQDIDAFVQVACPRLSIDWGYAYNKPLLTPYEANVMLKEDVEFKTYYPMDYYSADGYGRGKKPLRVDEL